MIFKSNFKFILQKKVVFIWVISLSYTKSVEVCCSICIICANVKQRKKSLIWKSCQCTVGQSNKTMAKLGCWLELTFNCPNWSYLNMIRKINQCKSGMWIFLVMPKLCNPFIVNWICYSAWKYLKPSAERPLEMVCYITWKLWNQWFPGNSDPLEPLVPKPHEFPLKNLGISDSLESVVPRNHLIPSADEMTVSFTISWTISFCEKWGKILWNCSVPICMSEIIEFYQTDYILKVNKSNTQE